MSTEWIPRAVLALSILWVAAIGPMPAQAGSGSVTVEWGGPGVAPPPPPPPPPAVQFEYRYYPEQQVYFDTSRSVYFYMDRGSWRTAARLPAAIALAPVFVPLSLATPKPYLHYREHRVKYPPGRGHGHAYGHEKKNDRHHPKHHDKHNGKHHK